MRSLLQDLRYALRSLRISPGFSAAVIVSLALGLGANTAIFSAVDGVLLRPLPYADADRLITVFSVFHQGNDEIGGLSLPDYRAFRDEAPALAGLAAAYIDERAITDGALAERARTGVVTPGLFALLGVPMALGREPAAAEATYGQHQVVVLSYALWQRRFGGDPSVLGRTLELNGAPWTIIGVAPRGFAYPRPNLDVYAPIAFKPGDSMDTRGNHFVDVIGRLEPGATVEGARAELASLAARLEKDVPENQGIGSLVRSLRDHLAGDLRGGLLILLGAVALVLLIACANLANLLLARGTVRQKEIAVRAALGASRGRIVRQLLTESIVLAVVGGVAGIALAGWLLDAIVGLAPDGLRSAANIAIDGRVLAFTAALSLATGVGFGLAPALIATRLSLSATLQAGGRALAGGHAHRLRQGLVIGEVAVSLVLLVSAGLLLRSFAELRHTQLGFDPEHVLTGGVQLAPADAASTKVSAQRFEAILERLARLPGVTAAGAATSLPMDGGGWGKFCSDVAHPAARLDDVPLVRYILVGGDYFRAVGMTLAAGRLFGPGDRAGAQPVALVNETAARKLFGGVDRAVGQSIRMAPPAALIPPDVRARVPDVADLTVVGVLRDAHTQGAAMVVAPEVYQTFAQASDGLGGTSIALRTAGDPAALADAMRRAVAEVDPRLPILDEKPLTDYVGDSMAQARFHMVLLAGFAILALVLALLGVYGVMSYAVNQRTRELGIRVALGATGGDVLRLVLREGLGWVAIGLAAGLAGAFAATRLLSGLLYGVAAADPATFVVGAALLATAATAALILPARRAARVDPMQSLRSE